MIGHSKVIVFVDETLSEFIELLRRLVAPPVRHVAELVILTPCNRQKQSPSE